MSDVWSSDLLAVVLRFPKTTLGVALIIVLLTLWPLSKLGSEFMPPLNEGDLLYMPTALPGLSVSKASEILQLTDRLIKTVPEVKNVRSAESRLGKECVSTGRTRGEPE